MPGPWWGARGTWANDTYDSPVTHARRTPSIWASDVTTCDSNINTIGECRVGKRSTKGNGPARDEVGSFFQKEKCENLFANSQCHKALRERPKGVGWSLPESGGQSVGGNFRKIVDWNKNQKRREKSSVSEGFVSAFNNFGVWDDELSNETWWVMAPWALSTRVRVWLSFWIGETKINGLGWMHWNENDKKNHENCRRESFAEDQ